MSRLNKTTKVTLGIPTMEDLDFVASMARESDRHDMEGLNPDMSIKDIIMHDVEHSRVVYGLYLEGIIHAVFGVIPAGKGRGTPWLVGTSAVDKNPLPFARASRNLLDMIQKIFPLLDTWVCAENSMSLNWHRWCGFEFTKTTLRFGRDDYYRAVRSIDNMKSKEKDRWQQE